MSNPKLSIITVNLNNDNGLEKTIRSVVDQTWKNFEFLIVDGGSSDKSLEIIKSYADGINFWISEKDKGIYHAMNKGISIAKGEYLLMLNSGDFLCNSDVLQKIFENLPPVDIAYADILWEENGNIEKVCHPEKLSFDFFRHNFLTHQSTFIRKSLHYSVGMYDENFKIIADWKFFLLAICKFNASYGHIPLFLSQFERNGISVKAENWGGIVSDKTKIFEEEFGAFLPDYKRLDYLQNELNVINRKLYTRIENRLKKGFAKTR